MSFTLSLTKFFSALTLLFLMCISVAAGMEYMQLGRQWIGYFFIFITLGAYALIGLMSRTSDLEEYFIAGRQVPAVYNGMATAADWMSAASFLGVAGTLYYNGFEALAYLVGWTGGFVLIALLVAPYLRKFNFYSVGDFLAARYAGEDDGRLVRVFCIVLTVAISFVYLIAQIYGVGLITSRFAGVEFGIGVFFGLAGILVCSFLGGMRAVTWTQVAQYLVMIISMLIVMVALLGASRSGFQFDHGTGKAQPVSLATYIRNQEDVLFKDPREKEVRDLYQREVRQLDLLIRSLPSSWQEGYEARRQNLEEARYNGSTFQQIKQFEKILAEYPQTPQQAKKLWTTERDRLQSRVKASQPHYQTVESIQGYLSNGKAMDFLAIAFTLMCGTVALPHVLIRFFTTPNASQTRWSVVYALGFILVLYLLQPWVAAAIKAVVYERLVGVRFSELPNWVAAWQKVSNGLATLRDVNEDGVVQYAEIVLSTDILVLIAPDIAGLPFFLSGLIAVGGLAAALSTADGLLLSIANAFSHDLYFRMVEPQATAQKRVTISKIALMTVALVAAWVTSMRPGNIVYLVGAAFALAGSSFFVPLVAGVFWSKATRKGAMWAMAVGFGTSATYILLSNPGSYHALGFTGNPELPLSVVGSGVLTIPLAAIAMILASKWSKPQPVDYPVIVKIRKPENL